MTRRLCAEFAKDGELLGWTIRGGWCMISPCVHWRGIIQNPLLQMGICKKRDELVHNNFLMDFENWCLQHCWDARKEIPVGPNRYAHPEWSAMIKRECENSDTTFQEYCEWCKAGGGDDWFQEEEIPSPTEEQL